MKKILTRLFKILAYSALGVIGVIAVTLLSFWIELQSSETLPIPTGEYVVGRTSFHWVDSSRTDSLSPYPHTKRELVVWIWYPASTTGSGSTVEYLPAEWEEALDEQAGVISKFWARDGARIHPHSVESAILSDKQPTFPILLMKSGIGTMAIDYTTYAEELASHGYVVVGNDAPYSTWLVRFPDGRVVRRTSEGNPGEAEYFSDSRDRIMNRLINIWTDDTRFVLNKLEQLNALESSNQFWGRLDVQSVGVFGHSFGGATAAQFCFDDYRCKAGVDIDGAPYGSVIENGLKKPFMFLLADHEDETDSVSMQIKSNIESIYNSSPGKHIWISLRGANHFNFSDMPFQSEFLTSRLFGATGSIGGRRGLEIASVCLRTFFDEHLKGQLPSSIRELSKNYPEINLER